MTLPTEEAEASVQVDLHETITQVATDYRKEQ
jgi:hypothetical protein